MLKIKIVMNTAMEEIYSKKCCGYHDLNLEIQIWNEGPGTLSVPSYLDLEGDEGVERVDNLMPHGTHKLQPGRQMSFYCYMDEVRLSRFDKLVMYDEAGNAYRIEIGAVESSP